MTAKQPAERAEYTVTINGVEHTVRMTEEEAEKAGATKASGEKQAAPANKARVVKSKDG